MNLQKLQVFLTLYETLNYTETAERLYISQGNVSKQIMALEKELGVQLFDRSRRHIRITKEGKVVEAHARRILDSYQQITVELSQLQEEKENEFLLHGIPSMPFYAIILDNLLKHKCDIIFARQFNDKLPKEVEMLTIDQDRWVVVLPSQHPLARKESINLKELEGEKFLQLSEKTQLLQPLLELCHAYQFDLKITYKGNRINLIIDFIENDLGLSLMMEKMIRSFEGKQIIWRPLDIETESLMVLMKLKTNKSEAVQQFWQEMQENYAKKD